MRKFLGSFRNNIGLKLISVVVAIVIWYIVVDIDDPVETNTYTVKISVANEAYIASGKEIYHIDDANKTVGVSVRANRSTLRSISEDDITVTADFTQIVDMNRDPVMVPLTAECKGVSRNNITLARTTIPITIESIATKTFAVAVDTGESVPSEEYEVGRVTVSPDQIVINGPESIINQIDTAVARIDVTGMTIDSSREAKLVLLGKDQSEISEDTITDDLTFEGGTPNVTVNVELWKRRSDVVLDVQYFGTPAEGYHVESVTTTPDTITVVGDSQALLQLTQNGNVIQTPADLIGIEGADEDVYAEIHLTEILPENMRLSRNTAEEASTTIAIRSDETKELVLDVDSIEVLNIDSNLAVSYGQAEITVRIKGSGANLDSVTEENIGASIDLAGMAAGDMNVPVNFTLPAGVSVDEAVTLNISLKEKVAAPAEESAEDDE